MVDYQQRVDPWLEPIAGGEPGGADARYDPIHESIRDQVTSLDSPSGPDVDWPEVVKQGETLITSQSKDLLIACYAAYGLYQLEGLTGLAAGLWLVAELTDRYWDSAFPPFKRLRARVNAFDWLTDRLDLVLPETPIDESDRAGVGALRAAADRLSEVVSARFEDPAPKMRPLLDSVHRLEISLPPLDEASPPAATPEAATSQPAEPAPAATQQPPPAQAEAPSQAQEMTQTQSEVPSGESTDGTSEGSEEVDFEARLAEIAAPFVLPIPGDSPTGEDCRYDPEHEAIRNTMSQLDLPTGGDVEWAEIEKSCTTLLKEKTKDVLIASYLGGAMFERRGLIGVAEGLAVLTGIINTFWDDGFPPARRLRARSNALEWLLSRLEVLAEQPVVASDKDALNLLDAASKQFTDTVYERFEDEAPAVRPLLNNVHRLLISLPAPALKKPVAPPPAAAQAPSSPAPTSGAQAPQPPAKPAQASMAVNLPDAPPDFVSVKDLDPFLKKIGASLHKGARAVFKADTSVATAYRLARVGLLLHMETAPPITSGRQTGIPAPAQNLVKQLEALLENQNWAALLEEAESALGANRMWLDIHRYVAVALGGLGHDAARKAVVDATADLLKRLPELRDLQFNTGLPLASAATQKWFDAEVISAGGADGGSDGLTEEERGKISEARSLAGSGKISDAIELLDEVRHGARSVSVSFRARLAAAQVCVVGGSAAAADGLYSALYKQIDEYRLEHWDPDLVAGCYTEHYEVLKSLVEKASERMTRDPSLMERLSKVYARLCRVSPSTALKLDG